MSAEQVRAELDEVQALRRRLWTQGYRPLAVWSPDACDGNGQPLPRAGKRPQGNDWRERALRDPPDAVTGPPDSRALGTGILCRSVVAFDVDVLVQEIVDLIVSLIERVLGVTPLTRIGRAPKILLAYRTEQPFGKVQTPEMVLPDGSDAKVELLANGQQFVAFGIHPDTREPYRWINGSPETVPLGELPVLSEEQARQLVAEAETIMREAGAREKKPKPPRPGVSTSQVGVSGDFFRQVNSAALSDIGCWARDIFPDAEVQPATGAWRVSSEDLGRDLQEDLSIHPDGIKDWGIEEPRTAVDLVIAYGGAAAAVDAALWLCDRLGLDPAGLGYRTHHRQASGGSPQPNSGDNAAPGDTEMPPHLDDMPDDIDDIDPDFSDAPLSGLSGNDGKDRANQAQHHWGSPSTPSFRDPWEEPSTPEWPPDVLPMKFHDMLFEVSIRDGLDPGAQGMTMLAAISGAAPKNARFYPYGVEEGWAVPPIIWAMIIAISGQRKTALIGNAFAALRKKHAELWKPYLRELKEWRALPPKVRQGAPKPEEPHSFMLTDTTPEKLQMVLAETDRGTLLLRDELAGMFEFGRYSKGGGAAERAFYLEAYEGGPFTVHRVTRDSLYIPVNGLTIYGHIQPDRLGEFSGLASDGLLQRFAPIRAAKAGTGRAMGAITGEAEYHAAIARLADLRGRTYRTSAEGSQIIRQMEKDGTEYATITDYGVGFQGFCGKLHGTLARLALLLQLLDDSDTTIVQPDAVIRADRLVRRFLLPHACDFYGTLSADRVTRTRDIAAWLLTSAPAQIVASDFGKHVRACRGLSLQQLNEALDPLVGGGWLEPQIPFPSNRKWKLQVEVRSAFTARAIAAAARREEVRRLWESIAAERRAGR